MRIIVEAGPKQGSKTVATFIHNILSQWGIAATLAVDGNKEIDYVRLQKIAKGLKSPVEVIVKIVAPEPLPFKWTEFLVIHSNLTDEGPYVKGTSIKASDVISLVIDGHSWKDILQTHPELTEDSIRACLRYAIEEDGQPKIGVSSHEHHQENPSQREQESPKVVGRTDGDVDGWAAPGTNYSRRYGRPYLVRDGGPN